MLTPEREQALAKSLAKNKLLPILFDSFADDIRDKWESTKLGEAETREHCWLELRTLDDLRDFIYARINELAGDG